MGSDFLASIDYCNKKETQSLLASNKTGAGRRLPYRVCHDFFARAVEPLVLLITNDLLVEPATAALLIYRVLGAIGIDPTSIGSNCRYGWKEPSDAFVPLRSCRDGMQTIEPGTICLSRAAYDLAQGFITAVSLAPIQVKGIEEPIERVQLISADRTKNRWDVQAGKGLAAFAGRSKELKTLRRAFADRAGTGVRLIQIGLPAIGKSREPRHSLI